MDVGKREVTQVNLDTDFEASTNRLEELKANRELDNIPLNDEYWKALKRHRLAYKKGTYKDSNE